MNPNKIKQLIETVAGSVPVFLGRIPASESEAVGIAHIANITSRTITGSKAKNNSSWRISVVGPTEKRAYEIKELILTLDNTSTVDFQRVTIDDERWHEMGTGSPVKLYTVDLTTRGR